mgnify:FL=1
MKRAGQQTDDEDELEVAMWRFLLSLRELFVSFFHNDLDWDRIHR